MSDKKIARADLASSIIRRATIGQVSQNILTLIGQKLPEELKNELASVASEAPIEEASFHAAAPFSKTAHVTFQHFFPQVTVPEILNGPVTDAYLNGWETAVQQAFYQLSHKAMWGTVSLDEFARTLVKQDFRESVFTSKKQFKEAALFLARTNERLQKTFWSLLLENASVEAKSRFSRSVNASNLDDVTLSVVAYMVARGNRKTEFTTESQSRTFDTIHEGLVKLIPANANWVELAKVYPVGFVLHKLNETQLEDVIDRSFTSMSRHAKALKNLHGSDNKAPLISMHGSGVDTTSWNLFAGAYNNARSAWVNATVVAGNQEVFTEMFPGKMSRYIAGDVMRMHTINGSDVSSANTLDMYLFNTLPHPWDVISYDATLTVDGVTEAAFSLGAVPAEVIREMLNKNGWLTPRADVRTEEPSVDKILVHGVQVESDELASLLKKIGAFSGKVKDVPAASLEELDEFLTGHPHIIERSSTGTRVIAV